MAIGGWDLNRAPTNPAYNNDLTYFQSPVSIVRANRLANVDFPPMSIFEQSRSFESQISTGFVPKGMQKSTLSIVFFSQANLEWIRQLLKSDVLKNTNIPVAVDATNLKLIMSNVWDEAYINRSILDAQTVRDNLAQLDAHVRKIAYKNITEGMRAALDYEMKVGQGPQFAMLPPPISAGNKTSSTKGTIDTSAVLFGTNTNTTAGNVNTLSQAERRPTVPWGELALESAAWHNPNSYRESLEVLPI